MSSTPGGPRRRSARVAALAVAAILAVAGVGTQAAQAAPATTPQLLSYAKPASASSFQNENGCTGCSPDKAFDEDAGTRWATSSITGWVDPGWIQVDLGAPAVLTEVVLQWDPAYGKSYEVQVSDNGQDWNTIYSTTTGQGGREDLTVSGAGRYVRLNLLQRNGLPYGYSLYSFQVFGTGGDPTPPPNQATDPDFDHLSLAWSDEFNDPAGTKPDAADWTPETGGTGWGNNELEYYTDNQNVATDGDGHLVIQARKENVGGRNYTSARLNSTYNFQYGRIESRIKVPTGNGLWPAFWMMGTNIKDGVGWPYNGEVDFMEVLGKNTAVDYATIHGPGYSGENGVGTTYSLPGAPKLSDDFHTWTTDWDSKGFRYYLDGQLFFTIDKANVEATRGPWVYDHPFYLLLNLAIGGPFPGPPDATTPFPADYVIDYVRVYQSDGTTPPPDGTDDNQTITATVPQGPGEFSWTIDAADHSVVLSDAENKGSYLESTGDLKPVSVTDTRPGGPSWSISGQVGDFTGGLSGKYLGWSPTVLSAGAGATAGAVVGSDIDAGDGLTVPAVLGSAVSGHSAGSGSLGAGLDLRVPADTTPGTYTTTLTLTALS